MTPEKMTAVYVGMSDTDTRDGAALLTDSGIAVREITTVQPAEIIAQAQDADILLVGYAPITREVIQALPRVQLIALMSIGLDTVDVDAATEHGVWVTNIPAVATEEVAAHALALMLYSLRQLRFYLAAANPRDWENRAPVPPRRLSELTLGIVGLGNIGRELARVAGPLFGSVVGYDPLLPDTEDTSEQLRSLGIERGSLDDVLHRANVVSLHLPLTADTSGMVDAGFLAAMREGAVLVNVSRGGLVDSQALADALDSGKLSGAALDVLEEEPPSPEHPLLDRQDVVLTAHVAYFSDRSASEYLRIQAQNAVTFSQTGAPDTPVNRVDAR